jgi:hypothetical protein
MTALSRIRKKGGNNGQRRRKGFRNTARNQRQQDYGWNK